MWLGGFLQNIQGELKRNFEHTSQLNIESAGIRIELQILSQNQHILYAAYLKCILIYID